MPRKKHNDHGTKIPRHEVEALAQTLYPDLLAFFEREDMQREFEQWLKEHDNDKEGST